MYGHMLTTVVVKRWRILDPAGTAPGAIQYAVPTMVAPRKTVLIVSFPGLESST